MRCGVDATGRAIGERGRGVWGSVVSNWMYEVWLCVEVEDVVDSCTMRRRVKASKTSTSTSTRLRSRRDARACVWCVGALLCYAQPRPEFSARACAPYVEEGESSEISSRGNERTARRGQVSDPK